MELLTPTDLDRLLSYPRGRAKRLARKGAIPHVRLPDGEIRFDRQEIAEWLNARAVPATAAHEAT